MKKLLRNSLRSVFVILAMVLISLIVSAQTIEQIKADRQNYIWGEGTGITLNSADLDALGMLSNQISVQVESRYNLLRQEVTSSGKQTFEEVFKGVINTYSSATLRNTERIVISNEPDAKVFRYIKRNEIDKIFSDRERKIVEFARNGEQSALSGRVADALRYYYWSLTLLRSHPNANTIGIKDEQGIDRLLITWLPMQINTVLADVRVTIAETNSIDNLTRYFLNIRYKNEPARNFDYSYWTGRDWTNIYSAKDGLGIVEFIGQSDINEIRFKAEYVFEGETAIDNELRDVMAKLSVVPFRSSYFSVPIGNIEEPISLPKTSGGVTMVKNTKPYEEKMNSLLSSIRSQNHQAAQALFTPEGYEMYKSILQYGQARIVKEPEFKFIHFENGVMCRSLSMSFRFKNNNRNFMEDVVFHFNEDKKISNISFGLDQRAINDIIGKDVWDERVRLILITFLENYKTAYALKRADYIESLFADDALIIVGSVLRVKATGDNPYRNNDIVKFNRYTKEQFIRNLRHSFASNEFINIRFEDNTVRKSGKGGEVYGIEIKQNYFSSNYGDSGYLFLMVDFNDANQPVIHIRAWHPEKNFSLADFM